MQLQNKGNRFVVVNKEIDQNKAQEQINRTSFKMSAYEPISNHKEVVSEQANKSFRKGKISKEWRNNIINKDTHPGKKLHPL